MAERNPKPRYTISTVTYTAIPDAAGTIVVTGEKNLSKNCRNNRGHVPTVAFASSHAYRRIIIIIRPPPNRVYIFGQ